MPLSGSAQRFFTEDSWISRFFKNGDTLTSWLVIALRRELASPRSVRLLTVLGPSGSGKSSVVRAGLVRSLQNDEIEGSKNWPIAILQPGHKPVQSLARCEIVVGLDTTEGGFGAQKKLEPG